MRLIGNNLRCVRGGREVFAGLDFAVAAGGALLVTGPNATGKSSLLRLIAGLLRPVQGAVTLKGGDPELTISEQAHYLGHHDPLKPALTVAENLQFWTAFLGSGGLRVPDALARVGLGDLAPLPAAYLSAGQRRRLAFARLLTAERPIWLLDEPTSALDAAGEDRLLQMMKGHLSAGGIIVEATHAPVPLPDAGELRLGSTP